MKERTVPDPMGEEAIASGLVQSAPRRFVLVTGAGRSGTSTVAGSLNYLGLHVPRPFLGANRSNPRGFFESRWSIDFHKRLLEQAGVDMWDGRPEALEKVQNTLTPEHRVEIEGWLGDAASTAPQVAVKDPRSAWAPVLWAEAAHAVGCTTGFITMLRHPAEVVGSRSTYYAKGDAAAVRGYQVTSIARWINATLITERQTRGRRRALVRYDDLIEDWRSVMARVRDDLDLTLNTAMGSGEPHPVDDFIDPDLRRHQIGWEHLDVPDRLRAIAEETWLACGSLADSHGEDEKAQAELDALSARYASLFRDATAISHDVAAASAQAARKKAVRQTRAKMKRTLAEGTEPTPAKSAPTVRRIASRSAAFARRRLARHSH